MSDINYLWNTTAEDVAKGLTPGILKKIRLLRETLDAFERGVKARKPLDSISHEWIDTIERDFSFIRNNVSCINGAVLVRGKKVVKPRRKI